MDQAQYDKIANGRGFIAAMDQSGGSTPKMLKLYGIDESAYQNEVEMFDLVHQMRSRIVTDPSFDGDKILGTILFEMTMDREFDGLPAASYLWQKKHIVPFLKVDKGLEDLADGVQLMKPMPALDALLDRATQQHVFGTKMRSFIAGANHNGIKAVVAQQFDFAKQILAKNLMPIVEPEVDINAPDKQEAETILRAEISSQLDALPDGLKVILKLTLPSVTDFYAEFVAHPKVLRVVALSGGYSRAESCRLLADNHGLTASFSRALTEGLFVQQTDAEFSAQLERSIDEIYAASIT